MSRTVVRLWLKGQQDEIMAAWSVSRYQNGFFSVKTSVLLYPMSLSTNGCWRKTSCSLWFRTEESFICSVVLLYIKVVGRTSNDPSEYSIIKISLGGLTQAISTHVWNSTFYTIGFIVFNKKIQLQKWKFIDTNIHMIFLYKQKQAIVCQFLNENFSLNLFFKT